MNGFSPDLSALCTIGTATVLYVFTGGHFSPKQLLVRGRKIIEAFQSGAKALAIVAVLIASAQVLVSLVGLTGFGNKFSSLVVNMSGESLILTLVLAAIVCLILGMGMPATGAYVLSVAVVGIALTKLGVAPIGAHMFVFYFSIISAVTPPVCAAVFVAAALAETPWLKAAWVAVRLALPTFIIGFMFALNPILLLQGEPIQILLGSLSALLGVICMGAGTMGYLAKKANWIERCVLIAAAIMLIVPDIRSDIAGFVLFAAVYLYQRSNIFWRLWR